MYMKSSMQVSPTQQMWRPCTSNIIKHHILRHETHTNLTLCNKYLLLFYSFFPFFGRNQCALIRIFPRTYLNYLTVTIDMEKGVKGLLFFDYTFHLWRSPNEIIYVIYHFIYFLRIFLTYKKINLWFVVSLYDLYRSKTYLNRYWGDHMGCRYKWKQNAFNPSQKLVLT